jgi:hypothetical protein
MPEDNKTAKSTPDLTFLFIFGSVVLTALFLCLLPSTVYPGVKEINTILTKAYGEKVAKECSDYYSGLNIPEDKAPSIQDAVERLVEAGYPSGCPIEYLKVAAGLSRAGIDFGDLTNKIREGIAKKVEPARLIRVIIQRAEALQEARVVVLSLEEDADVEFLDRQMAYSVIADYLLRGISRGPIVEKVSQGDLSSYPALENLIR